MIDDLLSSGKHIPFLFMEWDPSLAACSSLATKLRAHGYTSFINFGKIEVDTIINCHRTIDMIWIHEDEKNLWKENRGNCSCERNSSGFSSPRVRCELDDAIIVGNTIYKALLFGNQHYHNIP